MENFYTCKKCGRRKTDESNTAEITCDCGDEMELGFGNPPMIKWKCGGVSKDSRFTGQRI